MLSIRDIMQRVAQIDNWTVEGASIVKALEFNSFRDAMEYVNKVAEVAETSNHHPDIFISYKQVRLVLTTHSEGGLSEKDFQVAKCIDNIS